MDEDLTAYSRNDRKRIARRARRRVNGEAVLILTAGCSIIMIFMALTSRFTFLPIALMFQVNPTFVWVTGSFLISAIWALLHVSWSRPKVNRARALDAAFLYEQQDKRKTEVQQQIKELAESTQIAKTIDLATDRHST